MVNFGDELIRVIVLYATGAHDFTSAMDDLTVQCSERQWKRVLEVLAYVDTIMVENGVGSVAQVEEYLARKENRENRYPLIFNQDAPEADAQIALLVEEFKKRGIVFQE